MADRTLQEFLDNVNRTNNGTTIAADRLHDADFSSVAHQRITDAATHGTVDIRTGDFTGANRSAGVDVKGLMQRVEDAKEHLETSPDSKYAQKRLADAKKDLERRAEHIYRDAGKAHALHEQAIEQATKDHDRLLKQLDRHHETAMKALEREDAAATAAQTHVHIDAAGVATRGDNAMTVGTGERLLTKQEYLTEATRNLNENRTAAQRQIKTQLERFVEDRHDHMDGLRTAAQDIEKETGIAHEAHFNKSSVSSSLPKDAAKEGEGMLAKMGKGWNKSGTGTKVAVGALAVLGADGVRRVVSGFSPGTDDQGKPKEADTTGAVVGAVETGGALLGIHHLLTKGASAMKGFHFNL